DPNPGLALLPLAARRALDVAGIALSLEAWRGLTLDERRLLIAAGAGALVAVDTVERIAARARPAPEPVPPVTDPDKIVPELGAAAGERLAELEREWLDLVPLERYALVKLARSKKADPAARALRLERALSALLPRRARDLTHLTPE